MKFSPQRGLHKAFYYANKEIASAAAPSVSM